MRRIALFFCIGLFGIAAKSQDPVHWQFTSRKLEPAKYELHMVATTETPWHIYSQTQNGGPIPTKFVFRKSPIITMEGTPSEIGDLHKDHDKILNVDIKYFPGKVEFVQEVTVKSNLKTAIIGTVEFMACNDEKCLPPKTIPFKIYLNN